MMREWTGGRSPSVSCQTGTAAAPLSDVSSACADEEMSRLTFHKAILPVHFWRGKDLID